MSSTTDRAVDSVVYSRAPVQHKGYNCEKCVGHLDANACDSLSDEYCSMNYVFRVADIIKSPQKASEASQGVKFDDGKTLYSLVPPYALEAVAKNLTSGLTKYKEIDNWKKVPDAKSRYLNALYRHLEQHRKGEIYDKDNIDPSTTHLSAVAVNAMFLLELALNPELNKEKTND